MADAAIVLLVITGATVAFAILQIGETGSPLFRFAIKQNPDLAEEIGWPELVREVARIYATLPPDEQARTAIYCANYGEAGAIDLYGAAFGLPPAISGINSYWLRGPGHPPPETLIVLGGKRERLQTRFTSVELAGHTPNPWRIENEETRDHPDIFLCHGLCQPWSELWPQLRSFG